MLFMHPPPPQVFDAFKIRYVLNVTPTCPNYFEEEGGDLTYMRIAVTDTGTQKVSDKFQEAFDFIGKKHSTCKCVVFSWFSLSSLAPPLISSSPHLPPIK